jgi:hypothetical protein
LVTLQYNCMDIQYFKDWRYEHCKFR